MTHRISLASLVLSLASMGLGCETTGATMPDTGLVVMPDSGVDGGPALQTSYSYTPTGCTYMVRTPTVTEAGAGRDDFGATPMADHVHASWAGPTDTTFAVNWRSDVDTHASSLLVGTDQAAVMAADGATTGVERHDGHFMVVSSLVHTDPPDMIHEAHVCGLTPNTTYYYRVGGTGHWSSTFSFSTGPTIGSTDPYMFGVTGDSRGYDMNAWAITEQRMQARAVDFEIFSGDAVEIGNVQSEWDQFFEQEITGTGAFQVQDFLASHAMMMANGNHDVLSPNYLAQFALPQDVSPSEIGQGEDWYSFDYANAHFVVLNDTVASDTILSGDEAAWLRSDLMAVNRTTTPWVFVMHHQPLYTCSLGGHNPDTTLRSAWQPIFDQFHVDIVFAGHNHEYERSHPIFGYSAGGDMLAGSVAGGAPTFGADGNPSGSIYIVAAGAGAPLYPCDMHCPETAFAQSVRAYVTFQISNRTLTMNAYDSLTDTMIDTLSYTK